MDVPHRPGDLVSSSAEKAWIVCLNFVRLTVLFCAREEVDATALSTTAMTCKYSGPGLETRTIWIVASFDPKERHSLKERVGEVGLTVAWSWHVAMCLHVNGTVSYRFWSILLFIAASSLLSTSSGDYPLLEAQLLFQYQRVQLNSRSRAEIKHVDSQNALETANKKDTMLYHCSQSCALVYCRIAYICQIGQVVRPQRIPKRTSLQQRTLDESATNQLRKSNN